MGALQPGHLIVILVIVLLVFGPGKLPELGKAVGDGLRELKKATEGEAGTHAATATASGGTTAAAAPATAAPGAGTSSRTCPSCHTPVPASDKFCGSCGTAVPS